MRIWVPLPQRVTEEPALPCGGVWKCLFFIFLKLLQSFYIFLYCSHIFSPPRCVSILLHSFPVLPHAGRTDCLICLLPQLYHEECDDYNKAGNTASCRGEEWVRLTRLYQFARNVRALLHTYHYNQIFLTEFQGAYNKFTGCTLEPRSYGYISTDELLSAIPQVGINFITFTVEARLELNTLSVSNVRK